MFAGAGQQRACQQEPRSLALLGMTKLLETASDFWCKNLSSKPSLLVTVVEQWLSRLTVRTVVWKQDTQLPTTFSTSA